MTLPAFSVNLPILSGSSHRCKNMWWVDAQRRAIIMNLLYVVKFVRKCFDAIAWSVNRSTDDGLAIFQCVCYIAQGICKCERFWFFDWNLQFVCAIQYL